MKIRHKGIVWSEYRGALVPEVAPHVELSLNGEDRRYLLKRSGAYFLRWTSEWKREGGEFWYVVKEEKENLSAYRSKVRHQIRRGLSGCRVEPISDRFVAERGYDVYRKAFARYRTFDLPMGRESFEKMLKTSENTEYWGVFHGDRLIAYAQNLLREGMCGYAVVKIDPDYLKLYPGYALFHEMNRYYLNERNVLYVSDGARSISHETNIQKFLMGKFGFTKAYCRLHIAYRRDIGALTKLLYPFRRWMPEGKLRVLLKQEEIRRSFDAKKI